jgi:uncharacterized protein (TIGR00369 family)
MSKSTDLPQPSEPQPDEPKPSERGRFDWSPHSRALGFEFVSAEKALASLKLPFREDLVGDPDTGVIAGGAVTALLDHVCGHAVMMALDFATPIATLDLRIDYMRAAEPGLGVVAEAHCYKVTRSIAFVRASAWDRDRADPLATAQAAFMINSDSGRKGAVPPPEPTSPAGAKP